MTTLTDALGTDDGLLAVFPLRSSEIHIGYARVSTGGQKLDRQIDVLTLVGCRRIFPEKKSGKNDLRPELKACHAFLQGGDTLVVPSLDRYGRSLQDLVNMVAELRKRQIGFTSLHENLDTTTPGGRLIFHVFAALAEFIRELIMSGTNEGLVAARAAAVSAAVTPSSTPTSCAPPATCCPTRRTASRRSRRSSACLPARSTTTPRTERTARLAHPAPARRRPPVTPAQHRMKGAGLLLGASGPGQAGPYGPYSGEDTESQEDTGEHQTLQAAKQQGNG